MHRLMSVQSCLLLLGLELFSSLGGSFRKKKSFIKILFLLDDKVDTFLLNFFLHPTFTNILKVYRYIFTEDEVWLSVQSTESDCSLESKVASSITEFIGLGIGITETV